MLQTTAVDFQGFPATLGESMRHGRDMGDRIILAGMQRTAKYFGAVVAAVAGISGIVAAIYGIYDNRALFGFQSSEISIRPMASTRDFMMFLVENDGNGSASVGRVTGQFEFSGAKGKSLSAPLRLDVMEHDAGKSLIPPGASQQLRVHFANPERLKTTVNYLSSVGEIRKTECTFEFEIINYDGSRQVQPIVFDCREFVEEYLGMRNRSTIIF
jgi:hypothetical protein